MTDGVAGTPGLLSVLKLRLQWYGLNPPAQANKRNTSSCYKLRCSHSTAMLPLRSTCFVGQRIASHPLKIQALKR